MDEYEVDLREYLLILWKGKWIVAGVFVVAVALAWLLTARAPVEYRAEVLLGVERCVPTLDDQATPTAAWVAERVRHPGILSRAASEAGVSTAWLSEALGARVQGAFVQLTVQGNRPGAELAEVLDGMVAALHEDLAARVAQAVERRLTGVELEREAARTRLAAWEEEFDRVRTATEISRDRLREEIARVRDDPVLRTLSVGVDATIQGYLAQKELDLLYARLERAELALDEMERSGLAYVAGMAWRNLADQLVVLDEEEAALRSVLSEPPSPVSVVRGVAVSGPLKPNLKMNLAVAVVLGLFVGVLLAFLVHALRAPPQGGRELPAEGRTGPAAGGKG
ncbi:hypothetical protein H5T55_01625 [Candidatus Bipolaricaulota bacterium]|nr:hypothetical protein [Candidatus Bipolaricaulota bacterium]